MGKRDWNLNDAVNTRVSESVMKAKMALSIALPA
jgi:hypothetical protein